MQILTLHLSQRPNLLEPLLDYSEATKRSVYPIVDESQSLVNSRQRISTEPKFAAGVIVINWGNIQKQINHKVSWLDRWLVKRP
jgi:hypothetical protein